MGVEAPDLAASTAEAPMAEEDGIEAAAREPTVDRVVCLLSPFCPGLRGTWYMVPFSSWHGARCHR